MDIDKIEKRLEDAIQNGTEADVNYWRGYRDAVKAMQKAVWIAYQYPPNED